MVYIKFDFTEEIRRGYLEPSGNFFTANTAMIARVGMIASLPLIYLKYLDNLPMKNK